MKQTAALIALTAAFLAVPGAALASNSSSALASAAAAAAKADDGGKAKDVAEAKKYCMKWESTGSRMTKPMCLTKQEWFYKGVDIDDTKKGK